MTIAAGLLYEGGVLICADTLILSSNTMGIYESKLMVIHSEDGKAVFGVAGDDIAFAEAAVQHCRSPLIDYQERLPHRNQLAATIETVLASEFKQHVIDNQLFYTHNYNFVIAIHSKVGQRGSFCNRCYDHGENSARLSMRRQRSRFGALFDRADL